MWMFRRYHSEAEVEKKLRGRRAFNLVVPTFIEHRMVAGLNNTTVNVHITYILICSRVPKEDTRKIVTIQFCMARTGLLHAYSRPENTEMFQVGGASIPLFKWGAVETAMDASVVEIRRMGQGSGPIFRREGRAVQERPHCDRQGVIPFLSPPILGGTICTRGFRDVEMCAHHCGPERGRPSEVATLVAAYDTAGGAPIHVEEVGDEVDRWLLGLPGKNPDVTTGFINDEEVSHKPVERLDHSIGCDRWFSIVG